MYVAQPHRGAPRTSAQWLNNEHTHFKNSDIEKLATDSLVDKFSDEVRRYAVGIQNASDTTDTIRQAEEKKILDKIKEMQRRMLFIDTIVKSNTPQKVDEGLRTLGTKIRDHVAEYAPLIDSELSTINIFERLFDFDAIFSCNSYRDPTNRPMHYQSHAPWYVKIPVTCIVVLMYLFCFFQLVLSSLSVDTCVRSNSALVGVYVSTPSRLATCGDLVAYCRARYLDTSSITIAAYLALRIFFYLFSLGPLIFLSIASHIRSTTIIKRLTSNVHPLESHRIPFLTHKKIWVIGGVFFLLTHVIGAVFVLAADIEMIRFLSTLDGQGCPDGFSFALNGTMSPACGCRVLYDPPRGIFRMPEISGFQVKQVYDVAATLLFFNLVYTIWGVLFVANIFMQHRAENMEMVTNHGYTKMTTWQAKIRKCDENLHFHHNKRVATLAIVEPLTAQKV